MDIRLQFPLYKLFVIIAALGIEFRLCAWQGDVVGAMAGCYGGTVVLIVLCLLQKIRIKVLVAGAVVLLVAYLLMAIGTSIMTVTQTSVTTTGIHEWSFQRLAGWHWRSLLSLQSRVLEDLSANRRIRHLLCGKVDGDGRSGVDLIDPRPGPLGMVSGPLQFPPVFPVRPIRARRP